MMDESRPDISDLALIAETMYTRGDDPERIVEALKESGLTTLEAIKLLQDATGMSWEEVDG